MSHPRALLAVPLTLLLNACWLSDSPLTPPSEAAYPVSEALYEQSRVGSPGERDRFVIVKHPVQHFYLMSRYSRDETGMVVPTGDGYVVTLSQAMDSWYIAEVLPTAPGAFEARVAYWLVLEHENGFTAHEPKCTPEIAENPWITLSYDTCRFIEFDTVYLTARRIIEAEGGDDRWHRVYEFRQIGELE